MESRRQDADHGVSRARERDGLPQSVGITMKAALEVSVSEDRDAIRSRAFLLRGEQAA